MENVRNEVENYINKTNVRYKHLEALGYIPNEVEDKTKGKGTYKEKPQVSV